MMYQKHNFVHLSVQSRELGNPKLFACFTDESLNLVLRNIAEGCHRARQEEQIFTPFNLLGEMGFSSVLYGE